MQVKVTVKESTPKSSLTSFEDVKFDKPFTCQFPYNLDEDYLWTKPSHFRSSDHKVIVCLGVIPGTCRNANRRAVATLNVGYWWDGPGDVGIDFHNIRYVDNLDITIS
jgi:hypothetical protein